MKEFKGTKGEWTVSVIPGSNGFAYVNGGTVTIYGRLTEVLGTVTEECMSDAKLIAAAPEMLSLLTRIYDELECGGFGYDIEQLINKITE